MGINRNYIKRIASQLVHELYEMASADPQIMVTNWVAYAYNLICKESSAFMPYKCGGIDGFLSGDSKALIHEIEKIIGDKMELRLLTAWHELHWERSQRPEYEETYQRYIRMRSLELPNFTLSA